jgi:drug/metabolite transporter (DMT)-like permease
VPPKTISIKTRADLALAGCSLIWGVTFVVAKGALHYASVWGFLSVRFSLAAVLMAAFRSGTLRNLKKDELLAGAALGLFMFAGCAFQTTGLVHTTPAKSAFITGSSVVMVPLLLALLWRRSLSRSAGAGALAAILGLYFLTVPADGIAHLNRGDLLTCVSARRFATHILLVGEYTRRHSVSALSVLQVASCGILACFAAVVAQVVGCQHLRFELRRELYLSTLVCAVFATAVAFTIQSWAQRYTTPSHAAVLFTLEPVSAVITSYFAMRERLTLRSLAGAALVLVGILVAEMLGPAAPGSPNPAPV